MDLTIEVQTVNQRAYDRLCDLILSGEIEIGVRLDERNLAEKLGISRTPVREAIARLANEGVVEYRPYQGNFVRSFTLQQVHDLFEVREALESLSATLAAAQMTDADLTALEKIIERCHDALDAGNLEKFERMDQEFHKAIARASKNEILIHSLDRLGVQIQLARHAANRSPELPTKTKRERELILAALRKKNGERAGKLMRQHIEGTRTALLKELLTTSTNS